jgi:hypothetical protein
MYLFWFGLSDMRKRVAIAKVSCWWIYVEYFGSGCWLLCCVVCVGCVVWGVSWRCVLYQQRKCIILMNEAMFCTQMVCGSVLAVIVYKIGFQKLFTFTFTTSPSAEMLQYIRSIKWKYESTEIIIIIIIIIINCNCAVSRWHWSFHI